MSQTTLSERAVSDAAIELCSDADASSLATRIQRTSRPTPTDVVYSLSEWEHIIDDCTTPLALAIRDRLSTPALRRTLSAIAMKKSGEQSLITDAVNLTITGDVSDALQEKAQFLLYHGFKRLPPVTGALLAGWIQEVKLLDDAEYADLVPRSSSAGYYDPDEHWIAIRRDPAWGDSDAWPISKPGLQSEYDHSTTLHEFGHALHYMLGVQTTGSDTVDNRDNRPGSWRCDLRDEVVRADWQLRDVLRPLQAAYLRLERGETEPLDFKDYQAATIEEFIAEGYTIWATSPRYLKSEQPWLWSVFEKLR